MRGFFAPEIQYSNQLTFKFCSIRRHGPPIYSFHKIVSPLKGEQKGVVHRMLRNHRSLIYQNALKFYSQKLSRVRLLEYVTCFCIKRLSRGANSSRARTNSPFLPIFSLVLFFFQRNIILLKVSPLLPGKTKIPVSVFAYCIKFVFSKSRSRRYDQEIHIRKPHTRGSACGLTSKVTPFVELSEPLLGRQLGIH